MTTPVGEWTVATDRYCPKPNQELCDITCMFSDVSLTFSPRFATLHPALQVLAIVGCLTPLALVGWLYRTELRLVPRRTALTLLGLRLGVVAVLLGLILLRPVAAYSATDSTPGTVVIALDRSDSTSVADPQRPWPAKVRLARKLRLASDLASDRQLESWLKPSAPADDTAEGRLLRQVAQRVDSLTRGQIAKAVLSERGADLLAALGRRQKVRLVGFAATATDLDPAHLDELPPAGNDGQATDLRLPLSRSRDALAVVLLTDGQHTPDASPIEVAADLGKQGVRVFPVVLGDASGPPDISITSVRVPASAFLGADVGIEARVKITGIPDRDFDVELRRPGEPPLTQRVQHDGRDRTVTVRFASRFEQVGPQSLTVAVRPQPEEAHKENNERTATVVVADDTAKVLLVDAEARWEYHYLAGALARDRGTALRQVLFEAPRLNRTSDEELSRQGLPAAALPPGPDALAEFDAVVLGDVSREQLSPGDRKRLEQFVGERGGTLVVVAGPRSMPAAFTGRAVPPDDPLARLLPVESVHTVDEPDGFRLALSAEGRETDFLKLEATAEESEKRWAALPRHPWRAAGKAKPGATVLASPRGERAPAGDRTAYEREHGLIVRQNYGFGRVLYVGLDSTWRWRYKAGDAYHHRFWGQLVRWAAGNRPPLVGNEFVRFGPRKPAVAPGQEVEVGVRLSDLAKPLGPTAPAALRVIRRKGPAEEAVVTIPLSRIDGRPRDLEAKLRDLPPGEYAVELVIPELGEQSLDAAGKPLRAGVRVSVPESREWADLSPNRALLDEIAKQSGGRVFEAADAAHVAEAIEAQTATRTVRAETKLWQSWPVLAVLLTLLSLEWIARKWAALP